MLTTTASAVRTAAFAHDTVTFDYKHDTENFADTVRSLVLTSPTAENVAVGTVTAIHPVYGYRSYKLNNIRNLIIHSKR